MNNGYSELSDDNGVPVRWKAATILSVSGFLITVCLLLTKAGAKAERVELNSKRLDILEIMPARIDRLETRDDEVFRRLGSIESKVDRLLQSRAR